MADAVVARTESRIAVADAGEVSALLWMPERPRWTYVFGHGAGAGMRHAFMDAASERLARHGIATFRYQFLYMERRSGRPDPQPLLLAVVHAAVAAASVAVPGVPLVAGGKSMGGRMTSLAASEGGLDAARGLVFYGFPLHPTARPGTGRAEHLQRVTQPMLFLQGTRDPLADLRLLRPVCDGLAPRAHLHVVEGADHSFGMLKRSGRTQADVLDELAGVVSGWLDALEAAPASGGGS